jgi:hypothetical protein
MKKIDKPAEDKLEKTFSSKAKIEDNATMPLPQ